MAGLVPPSGPKPLRRGEGPAIHVLPFFTQTTPVILGFLPGIHVFFVPAASKT